jgi:hypothetical protein
VWCWCSGPMAAAFSTSSSAVNETRRGVVTPRRRRPFATTTHLPFIGTPPPQETLAILTNGEQVVKPSRYVLLILANRVSWVKSWFVRDRMMEVAAMRRRDILVGAGSLAAGATLSFPAPVIAQGIRQLDGDRLAWRAAGPLSQRGSTGTDDRRRDRRPNAPSSTAAGLLDRLYPRDVNANEASSLHSPLLETDRSGQLWERQPLFRSS